MTKPRVAVASLGGTITMTRAATGRGVSPSMDAAELLDAVPALAEVANLEARTLSTLPSASLSVADILHALAWARDVVTDANGVVLVQGTDTLEETAYLLGLYWDHSQPLVVTGAMRAAQQPGADGPANLLAAVTVAGSPESRDLGTLVVLNDEIHAASRVRKVDSTAMQAFASPPFGPIGRVYERRLTYTSRPHPWPALPAPAAGPSPRVAMIETHLGDEGELLRLVVGAGYDGIVISAFGAGHVSASMAEAVTQAVEQLPVVLSSRTGAGPVLQSTYGFAGSERDLIERGVIRAGWLDARKARLLLYSLLAADVSTETLRATFAARSDAPGGPTE